MLLETDKFGSKSASSKRFVGSLFFFFLFLSWEVQKEHFVTFPAGNNEFCFPLSKSVSVYCSLIISQCVRREQTNIKNRPAFRLMIAGIFTGNIKGPKV